jgi:hypothetical protein
MNQSDFPSVDLAVIRFDKAIVDGIDQHHATTA